MTKQSTKYRFHRPKKEEEDILFGMRPVIEAIHSKRPINRILIQKGILKERFIELRDILKGQEFAIQYVPVQKLDALTTGNHQGVVAYVAPIDYQQIETIVDEKILRGEKVSVLVLDRITDVRNFGGIARTAECHGVDAILIPSKGSALVTSDAVKTSAGALNRIAVCKTDNLKQSLFYLQQSGLRIITCSEKAKTDLYQTNLRGSVAIVVGSEENGISNDLINMSDISTKIPLQGNIASLNVGVATAIVLYEKIRQENNH